MNQTPAKATPAADIMESVLMAGDLAKMSQADRVIYYNTLCKSLDLNPLTQPFSYIVLNGKLTLYCNRSGADQLRRNRKVSVEIMSKTLAAELFTVHVKATDIDGRHDEDLGVVSMPETLKGEARANAVLKCITKAKRRVTLSICGLGFLDETEVADIPPHAKALFDENDHDEEGEEGKKSEPEVITIDLLKELLSKVSLATKVEFWHRARVDNFDELPEADYAKAAKWLREQLPK